MSTSSRDVIKRQKAKIPALTSASLRPAEMTNSNQPPRRQPRGIWSEAKQVKPLLPRWRRRI